MKNKEKYYEEILEAFCHRCTCEFKSKHVFKSNGCENIRCLDCGELTKQWLEAEYVEPIRLTRNEKAILESLPKEWKWIARNRDNCLAISTEKMKKDKFVLKVNTVWLSSGINSFLHLFNHLFQFIKWEDSEPHSIEELLKCEVVDDE